MPNPKMKTMGKECICGGGCTIFTDDFSTDRTGTDYTVGSGTWVVSAGVITCTSASATITENTAASVSTTAVSISASVNPSGTDLGRVIGAYVDSTHYWYAEIQPGATDGTLKLFEKNGSGAATQRGSTATITGYTSGAKTVVLCFTGTHVIAIADHENAIIYTASVTVASTKAGIGTGAGSSSVVFDDFSFMVHYSSDPSCPGCGDMPTRDCGCDGPLPRYGIVSISGMTTNVGFGCQHCEDVGSIFVEFENPAVGCTLTSNFPSTPLVCGSGTASATLSGTSTTTSIGGVFNAVGVQVTGDYTVPGVRQFCAGTYVCNTVSIFNFGTLCNITGTITMTITLF